MEPTNKLSVIDKPSGLSVPARAVPEEQLNKQIAYFCEYIEKLLSVKDNENNVDRMKMLLMNIKKDAWGLSIQQMTDAFHYYIDGKLSYDKQPLTPISGYLDTILFKKVITAYKELKAPKMDLKSVVIATWNHWKTYDEMPDRGVTETFDYLYDKGLLPKRDKNEKVKERYENIMMAARGYLYAPLFDERAKLEKEGLKDIPKFVDIELEMQSIRNGEHDSILPKFKNLVLQGYFKRLKKDLTELI